MFISDQISRLITGYNKVNNADKINTSKDSISELKINDEVKVTVVKTDGDNAVVKMTDGSEMNIAGNIPEGTTKGDTLYIKITGKQDGMPLLAEVITNEKNIEMKAQELTTLLKNIGINPNKENLDIVSDMNKAGIIINKENLVKLFDSINNNIPKDNAIFMIKNGIEITTSSANSFNNMINQSDFLESNLKVLIDTLSDAVNNIDNHENISAVNNDEINNNININHEENSMIGDISKYENSNDIITSNINQIDSDVNADNIHDVQILENTNEIANVTEENVDNPSNFAKLSTEIIDKPVDKVDNMSQNIENTNVSKLHESYDLKDSSLDEKLNAESVNNSNKVSNNNEKNDNSTKQITITLTKDDVQTSDVQKSIPQNKINSTLDKVELVNEESIKISNPEVINEINFEENIDKNNETLKTNNLENQFQDINKNDLKERKEKIKELRNEIGSIFREVRNSKEFPEEISLKRIIKSFKDVINDIENSKEIFDNETNDKLTKEVSRMKENLNLITDLNKYNTVVHIPIQMNNNKSVAELYVFNGDKENSKKKINENNATMFLSLGTGNMGQVESYIKVVNKTVECDFMTETKEGSNFINENKNHLSDLLEVYGYTLIKASSEVYNGDTLNIFEAIEKNKIKDSLNSFDAKA